MTSLLADSGVSSHVASAASAAPAAPAPSVAPSQQLDPAVLASTEASTVLQKLRGGANEQADGSSFPALLGQGFSSPATGTSMLELNGKMYSMVELVTIGAQALTSSESTPPPRSDGGALAEQQQADEINRVLGIATLAMGARAGNDTARADDT